MTIKDTDLTRHGLRSAVAQVCLSIGWTSIHSQPLEILVDVLQRYIAHIGRSAQDRAELYGRTDPNMLDLSQVCQSLGVNMTDLDEYVTNFEVAPSKAIPAYPGPSSDDLNILKPGSREVLHRPAHVHSHLPAMYPEMEEAEEVGVEEREGKEENNDNGTPDKMRKRGEQGGTAEVPKQADDGCPLREISSVMMTSSGFLSPCREGKMPDSKRPHVDPEEKKAVSRRQGEAAKKGPEKGKGGVAAKKDIYNRDAMIKQEMMAASEVKMEAPDYQEDFEDMIEVQQVQHSGPGHRVKEEVGDSSRVDSVLESVIQKGLRESSRMPKGEQNSDSDDWEPPEDMPPAPKLTKKEMAAEKKKQAPKGRAGRGGKQNAAPQQMSDLMPQHFTAAGGKGSPKTKMARIPKITERVSLPTPDSLGLAGMQGPMGAMAGMAGLGQNPLIPNPINPLIPNFYGFGGMSGAGAGLIPGLSPNLLGQMAMMQQVQAAASLASRPGDGEGDVTPDDEDLEEGEISPPRTPTAVPTFPIKREKSPEVDAASEKQKKELEKEKERERELEKEREKEKEKEREKREKEKQEEERRKALVLLTQERDRLKQEEERAKEKEAEKAKEREKLKEREAVEKERLKQEKREFEKEKKKAKKEKKEKDKDKDKEKDKEKSKKEKKKERKEKKKEKKEKEKEKEKKPDEPSLFAPVQLKIKPPAPPTDTRTSPDSTPSATPQTTPKLVIKNFPKEKDKDKDTESVPMLGFQPLRTGPARTPKTAAAPAAPSPTPAKPGEKRKSSRPPAGGPASKTPGPASKSGGGPASKVSTPGPGPKERKVREGRGRPAKSKEIIDSSVDSGDEPTPGIITETVGSYTDEAGNKVWICPACGKQDDGSPMIGCDQCDDWYHWLCVGINSEPSENQDWFCTRCMAKKQGLYLDKSATFHPKQKRK